MVSWSHNVNIIHIFCSKQISKIQKVVGLKKWLRGIKQKEKKCFFSSFLSDTDIRSHCYSCMAAVEWLSSNSLLKLHLWLPPGYTISSNFQCTLPTWSVKHPPGFPLRQIHLAPFASTQTKTCCFQERPAQLQLSLLFFYWVSVFDCPCKK